MANRDLQASQVNIFWQRSFFRSVIDLICKLNYFLGSPGVKGDAGAIGPSGSPGLQGPRGESGNNSSKLR